MKGALETTILELLETREAYAPDGLLRYGTWQPIAEILNKRGFRTPVDKAWWTSKSLANYYRRHLREKDERLKPSTTQ